MQPLARARHCSKGVQPVPKAAHFTAVPRSTKPCISPGSLNREPALAGGKGGNVTSAGWQVTPV